MQQQQNCWTKSKSPTSLALASLLEPTVQRKTVSLPLQFEFLPVEFLSKQFTKLNKSHSYRIHYLGPRFMNTLALHKKYAFAEKQPLQTANHLQGRPQLERYHIDLRKVVESHLVQQKLRNNSYYKSHIFYRAFEGMNPTLDLQNQVIFNSMFEGGNLDCVIKVAENQFDLFLRVDSNTKGHTQWFYFSVRNCKNKKRVKLNLCNLSKAKSLYESGMQPFVLSKKKLLQKGVEWQQGGMNLGIQKKQLRYEYLKDIMPNHSYFCLEFEYEFQYQNDQVFFAYCVPYTYSILLSRIAMLPQQYTHKSVLGKTLAGVDIPILHITNHQQIKEKRNILITGRMHPGEPNSSHMLQGFIQFLNSSCPQATQLRNRVNFFIVPMVNPDGVIIGNSRTSAAGRDLNRQFLLAQKDLFPEVALVKDFARRLHSKHGILMYLDFHGHSRKKNTFFYGPAFSISEPNYYKSRILPKLIEKINSNFRFHSCSFAIDEQKKQTARAVMFQHFRIVFTYTIETSIGYFYDCQKMATFEFNTQEWNKIGGSIAQGLSSFLVGYDQYELLLKQRRASRHKKRPVTNNKYTITEMKLQGDEQLCMFKKTEQLKIPYNDKSLFGSIIEELKVIKPNGYIKEIDDDQDSDAHDQHEDFQTGKLAEFNNLLLHIANHDKPKEDKKKTREHMIYQNHLAQQEQQNDIKYEEECRYFQEIVEVHKPATVQAARQSWRVKHARESTKLDLKQSTEIKNRVTYHHFISNNAEGTKKQKSSRWKMLNQSMQKKRVSEGEYTNDKISYFGQYHLFADKEQSSVDRTPSSKRHSLFSRQKLRSNKRAKHLQNSHFSSETYLEKPAHDQGEPNRQIYQPKVTKSNYEFKFDQIEAAVIKQHLKSQLYYKVARSTHSGGIGPASFYGIRQNLNLKLSNKKKFLDQQENKSNKKSLKGFGMN